MNALRDLGRLQSLLISANRCVDCLDPRCTRLCPEHVDVPAAMRLILSRSPMQRPTTWMLRSEDAVAEAAQAIQASFDERY